jgi:hypothetical protein
MSEGISIPDSIIEKPSEERVQSVLDSLLAQSKDFETLGIEKLKEIISVELARIDEFENVALLEQHNRFHISKETADTIGAIWILSGPGSYDEPFKPNDNPKLREDKPWLGWMDRDRILRGVGLARKIAEMRSGMPQDRSSATTIAEKKEHTKELISDLGPYIIYYGYEVENQKAREVIARDGMIIPPERLIIIDRTPEGEPLKVTSDQVRSFTLPDDPAIKGKEVAIVSHGTHLNRAFHMLNLYKPLPEGSKPYAVPVATPAEGREAFAKMEIAGLIRYSRIEPKEKRTAAEEPYPYQFLK